MNDADVGAMALGSLIFFALIGLIPTAVGMFIYWLVEKLAVHNALAPLEGRIHFLNQQIARTNQLLEFLCKEKSN